MNKKFDPIIRVEDDGLIIPEVGPWVEKKLNHLGMYCDIFTTGMRKSWDQLVYIDLYSCAGYCKIRKTDKIIYGSPLIAISIQNKFDKYIFCEKDKNNYESLNKRLLNNFSTVNYETINGDCNDAVYDIISHIPKPSKANTVLCFCFIDPYSLNLKFNTIKKLSNKYMDFLIHFSDMDGKMNRHNYLKDKNTRIDLLLDNPLWRDGHDARDNFLYFLYVEFSKRMKLMNYNEPPNMTQIRSDKKNLGLYHLVFYSRSNRGIEFWEKIQKYSDDQLSLGI